MVLFNMFSTCYFLTLMKKIEYGVLYLLYNNLFSLIKRYSFQISSLEYDLSVNKQSLQDSQMVCGYLEYLFEINESYYENIITTDNHFVIN